MKTRILGCMLLAATCGAALAQEGGLVTRPSRHSVAETADRLEAAVKASGTYKMFYRLDHGANALREAGATLAPSQLLLFGNPKGGAPLMKDAPTLGLDLPNRALIWEDASGKVWITYNDLRTLLARHGIKRTEEQLRPVEERQKALFDKAIE